MQIKPQIYYEVTKIYISKSNIVYKERNVDSLIQRSLFLAELRYNVQTINFTPV